jgi:adenine-specific DNA-methyltransferase
MTGGLVRRDIEISSRTTGRSALFRKWIKLVVDEWCTRAGRTGIFDYTSCMSSLPTLPFILDEAPVRDVRSRQSELGQFFTPEQIGDFMAGLFSKPQAPVTLLDAGAGEGALSIAFAKKWSSSTIIHLDAFELDDHVIPELRANLSALASNEFSASLHHDDFLRIASEAIRRSQPRNYNRVILNPPYRKMGTKSRERFYASRAGLETVNLYSAFVGLALDLMADGGEMVAIIPRSFCNGPYYRPFRHWLLKRAAIRQIHLFHSRREAFAEADVLQENVIVHLIRGEPQGSVIVSASGGRMFTDIEERLWPFDAIVQPDDDTSVIHVPTDEGNERKRRFKATLKSNGLDVATGPIVGFRLRPHLREHYSPGDAPLLYPQHLRVGRVDWPTRTKKPNAIALNAATQKWMFPRGWYVLVKRFSSKEERRRVVASLCAPDKLPGLAFGFENKVNVLHANRASLGEELARGLTLYLNSTGLDEDFRLFSGHTQVNATDLRRMAFPDLEALKRLGMRWVEGDLPAQDVIDCWVETL